MKSKFRIHHLTALILTSLFYFAAYRGVSSPIPVRLADAFLMIFVYTIPMMFVQELPDLKKKWKWIVGFYVVGTVAFFLSIPRIDSAYNPKTDSISEVLPAQTMVFIAFMAVQVFLNKIIREKFGE
jgi:hypothetical protein